MADPNQVNRPFTIMGSSFIPGAGELIKRLMPNQRLTMVREPTNEHDKNAVAVMWGTRKLGFVPAQLAAQIAPHMDAGAEIICRKTPPDARFGAFHGILELAYIPVPGVKSNPIPPQKAPVSK